MDLLNNKYLVHEVLLSYEPHATLENYREETLIQFLMENLKKKSKKNPCKSHDNLLSYIDLINGRMNHSDKI